MGFLSRFFRGASPPEVRSTLASAEPWLIEALGGGGPTAAGVAMSPTIAGGLPDVFSACQVLAQDLARTPLKLQLVDAAGNREDATEHPLWEILHALANAETTAYDFRYELMWDLLLHEQAYAEIRRSPTGTVVGLWRLDPTRVLVSRTPTTGIKTWTFRRDQDSPLVWDFDPDKPPIFELRMRSPVKRVKDALGLVAALETYGAKFFANGARLSGMFTAPALPANSTGEQTLREKVTALFSGPSNAHKFLVTNGDVKYTPFAANNSEAQLVELRKYMRSVVAGLFRIPPHKIGDLERATFSNIEHQEIEYVHGCLGPYYEAWSQALRRDVLTTRQYPRYDVLFDSSVLIQGDLASFAEALGKLVNNGIATPNDARRRLRWNTLPPEVGDVVLVNGNMVPITRVLTPPSGPPASSAPAADPAEGDDDNPPRVM